MELNEALLQISVIREQIARTQSFHGYRAHTTAFTGVVAIVAAFVQAWWHPVAVGHYLALWLSAAGRNRASAKPKSGLPGLIRQSVP